MFLPNNYNFEIEKLIKTLKKIKPKYTALQFPDGLLKFSETISQIISKYTIPITLIDTVYGSCCIDDKTAKSLNCELIVHFGHSCLVPVIHSVIPVLYIFVDIFIDETNLVSLINTKILNIYNKKEVCIMGTIQFNGIVRMVGKICEINVPQIKPLSPGEVLGCTSPIIKQKVVIFVADGRFHLESLMYNNPNCIYYRYCPFNIKLFLEKYNKSKVLEMRSKAIAAYQQAKVIGLIKSRLQQNNKLYNATKNYIMKNKQLICLDVDEIKIDELKYEFIDAYVQVSCPRLSLDWGHLSNKPILSTSELFLNEAKLDFYSIETKGEYKH